ncbi:MAG TPA: hypothetical protein DHV39_04505 [Verrucomicrobiales bacterium]|nr:hypothetical protein [Verrucomicrobiales bacterium]
MTESRLKCFRYHSPRTKFSGHFGNGVASLPWNQTSNWTGTKTNNVMSRAIPKKNNIFLELKIKNSNPFINQIVLCQIEFMSLFGCYSKPVKCLKLA